MRVMSTRYRCVADGFIEQAELFCSAGEVLSEFRAILSCIVENTTYSIIQLGAGHCI